MAEIRSGYPAIFERCRETAACFLHTTDARGTFEVSAEERDAFWETLYSSPGFAISVIACTPVAPVPTTATRLPSNETGCLGHSPV